MDSTITQSLYNYPLPTLNVHHTTNASEFRIFILDLLLIAFSDIAKIYLDMFYSKAEPYSFTLFALHHSLTTKHECKQGNQKNYDEHFTET